MTSPDFDKFLQDAVADEQIREATEREAQQLEEHLAKFALPIIGTSPDSLSAHAKDLREELVETYVGAGLSYGEAEDAADKEISDMSLAEIYAKGCMRNLLSAQNGTTRLGKMMVKTMIVAEMIYEHGQDSPWVKASDTLLPDLPSSMDDPKLDELLLSRILSQQQRDEEDKHAKLYFDAITRLGIDVYKVDDIEALATVVHDILQQCSTPTMTIVERESYIREATRGKLDDDQIESLIDFVSEHFDAKEI